MSQTELKRLKDLMRKMSSAQEYVFVNKYSQGLKNTQEVLKECQFWKPTNKELEGILQEIKKKANGLLGSLQEMIGLLKGEVIEKKPAIRERPIRRMHTDVAPGEKKMPFNKRPFQFHGEKMYEARMDFQGHEGNRTPKNGHMGNNNYQRNETHGPYMPNRPEYRGHDGKPQWDNNWNNLPGYEPKDEGRWPENTYNNNQYRQEAPSSNYNYVEGLKKPGPEQPRWTNNNRNKDNTRSRPNRQRKASGKPDPRRKKDDKESKREYEKPWLKGIKKPKDERTDIEKKNEEFGNKLSPEQDILFSRVKSCLLEQEMNVTFDDIIGHNSTKKQFTTSMMIKKVQSHIKHDLLTPHSGIILYGPPGTGKTMLAKAFAKEKDFEFMCVNPSSIASKYRGDSEQMVSILFQYARSFENTILFIDEIDGILGTREDKEHEASLRIKNQFLIEIDGINNKNNNNYLMIVAATNHPWNLDAAAWRRFTSRIYIPLPGKAERILFIKKFTEKIKLDSKFDDKKLAEKIKGYSGDDIKKLFSKLMMNKFNSLILEENLTSTTNIDDQAPKIAEKMENYEFTNEDFTEVLKTTKRSTQVNDIKRYDDFTKMYGEKDN